jgi:ribonuclease P protein component
VQVAESAWLFVLAAARPKPSMSIARAITSFTEREIRTLFYKARTQVKHMSLEIRVANATGDFGRMLIVIPRVVGTAPERNLIKRRLKAIFYQRKLYARKQDCIALVRKGAHKLSYDQLEALLTTAVSPT